MQVHDCWSSSILAGPWPQGLNVSQILLVLNINLVNKCSVLIYMSQLVRYPTIQSSDCKRNNKPVIWFDLDCSRHPRYSEKWFTQILKSFVWRRHVGAHPDALALSWLPETSRNICHWVGWPAKADSPVCQTGQPSQPGSNFAAM